ncbi:MAG: endopeptidase La, partial [Chloroflexi bacterium]
MSDLVLPESVKKKLARQRQADQEKPEVPEILPILPLADAVIYPFMVLPLLVQGERWVKLVDEALLGRKVIGLFRRKGGGEEAFDLEALGKTGTAAQVLRMARLPDGNLQLLFQGLARVQIKRLIHIEPYPLAEVVIFHDRVEPSLELEGLVRSALGLFQEVTNLAPYLPNELALAAANVPEPGTLADFIAANLNLKPDERQEILDTL